MITRNKSSHEYINVTIPLLRKRKYLNLSSDNHLLLDIEKVI